MKEETLKIFNKLNNGLGLITTSLTSLFGWQWVLFAVFLIFNVCDFITGNIKARVKKESSSKIGIIGILKKISYWILILVSFLTSYMLTEILSIIGINIEFIMFLGWYTLGCLCINEVRSIIENFVEIGIKVPEVLIKGLKIVDDSIENKIIDNNKKQS